MRYFCSYCRDQIRPPDDKAANGDVNAISHGICSTCNAVATADFTLTVEEITRESIARRGPSCQRRILG